MGPNWSTTPCWRSDAAIGMHAAGDARKAPRAAKG
jgi:hypothetical protein